MDENTLALLFPMSYCDILPIEEQLHEEQY